MSTQQKFLVTGGVICVVVMASIVVALVVKNQRLKHDQTYFLQLENKVQGFYQHQTKDLALEAEPNLEKVCYRMAQGPFNNGRLRCGIEIHQQTKMQPQEQVINERLSAFTTAVTSDKFEIINTTEKLNSYGGSVSAGLYNTDPQCTTLLRYSATTPATYPLMTVDYSFECSKDSSVVPDGFSYNP